MSNLKDQIEEKIRTERERSEKPGQGGRNDADEASKRFDEIRPRLDELSHATDKYSVKVGYEKGPYAAVIAVVQLEEIGGTWVAAWQIGTTVGGSADEWEVSYNPYGVDTRREWFVNSDDLFKYLTASIAERIVAMEADED